MTLSRSYIISSKKKDHSFRSCLIRELRDKKQAVERNKQRGIWRLCKRKKKEKKHTHRGEKEQEKTFTR